MKWWFKKPKKLNETTRLYALYGESANVEHLNDKIEELSDRVNNIPQPDLTNLAKLNQANTFTGSNRFNGETNYFNTVNFRGYRVYNPRPPVSSDDVSTKKYVDDKFNTVNQALQNANIANYKGNWNNSTSYNIADIVSLNDVFYLCVVAHRNQQPSNNSNYWKVLTFTVDTSNFITDSALTPIRNNITSLTNRVDALTNTSFALKRDDTIQNVDIQLYTNGDTYIWDISNIIMNIPWPQQNFPRGRYMLTFSFECGFYEKIEFKISTDLEYGTTNATLLSDRKKVWITTFSGVGTTNPTIKLKYVEGKLITN